MMGLARQPMRRMSALFAVALLGGCATFSHDGGFDSVSQVASERLGKRARRVESGAERQSAVKATEALLAKPLAMDDAVQIALLNNRGLQPAYAELGLSESDLVAAGRLPNPGFTVSGTHWRDGFGIERTFSAGVLGILTLPLATRTESRRFEETKLETADAMLALAADTQRAYIGALAAQQAAAYADQVADSAAAAAELAKRMREAGHFSKLDYAREEAFSAQTVAQRDKARQQAFAAREKLTRAMGLRGEATRYTLPQRLPDLPDTRPALTDVERFALSNRLDVQAMKLRTNGVASSLGLTKATSLRAADTLAQTAIDARSEVREAYAAYLTSYDVAKHYRDEVVPLRKTISDELLLRYNGMLVSTFELLTDARDRLAAVNGYIDALRDYWLAQTDLQQALGGRLAAASATAAAPMRGAAEPVFGRQ